MRGFLDRRTFLRGTSSIAIALPWLELMGCHRDADGKLVSADRAASQTQPLSGTTSSGKPRRLVIFYTPNGTIAESFFPNFGAQPKAGQYALTPAQAPPILLPFLSAAQQNAITPFSPFAGTSVANVETTQITHGIYTKNGNNIPLSNVGAIDGPIGGVNNVDASLLWAAPRYQSSDPSLVRNLFAPDSLKKSYLDRLTVFSNIDNTAGQLSSFPGHFSGMGCFLTGRKSAGPTEGAQLATGISLDQYVGNRIFEIEGANAPPFVTLPLATFYQGGGTGSISYNATGSPVGHYSDAASAFAALFGGAKAKADIDRLRARRRSVLDAAMGDISTLKTRLGAADKARLDSHLTSIRQLEFQITKGSQCTPAAGVVPPASSNDYPRLVNDLLDVATLALQCDLTRVVTLPLRTEGANDTNVYPWLGGLLGIPDQFCAGKDPGGQCVQDKRNFDEAGATHHGLSHLATNYTLDAAGKAQLIADYTQSLAGRPQTEIDGAISQALNWTEKGRYNLTRIGNWNHQLVRLLADKLSAIDEGGSTVFDNSAILVGSGLGNGAYHTQTQVPYAILGNMGGALKSGVAGQSGLSYVAPPGTPNNRLLVTLMNALGVPDDTFGDPGPDVGAKGNFADLLNV